MLLASDAEQARLSYSSIRLCHLVVRPVADITAAVLASHYRQCRHCHRHRHRHSHVSSVHLKPRVGKL